MRIAVAGASGLVGSQATNLAHEAGHDVVRLSRSDGIDLTDPRGLVQALADVEAVIDVTRSPPRWTANGDRLLHHRLDEPGPSFRRGGGAPDGRAVHRRGNRGRAGLRLVRGRYWRTSAHRARPVPWRVRRCASTGPRPGQVLARSRVEDRALVMDVPTQPVDSGDARGAHRDCDRPGVHGLGVRRPRSSASSTWSASSSRGRTSKSSRGRLRRAWRRARCCPGLTRSFAGPDWRTWLSARP